MEDDTNFVFEDYMKKVVVETFGKARESLTASLESEAFEGVLDLEQLYEAIKSIDI